MEKEKKEELHILKRALKFILKVLYDLLCIVCVLLIAIILVQRFTDSYGSIGGYKLFVVVSGSMVPRYGVGEVVICKEVDSDHIQIGDAIVYNGKTGNLKDKKIMHEVVEKSYDEKGDLVIHAKGLLNGLEDPEISERQVLGVVKVKSEILTVLYALASNGFTAFIIILALSINVFMAFKSDRRKDELIEDNDESDEENEVDIEKKYISSDLMSENQKIEILKENIEKGIEELDEIENAEKKSKKK